MAELTPYQRDILVRTVLGEARGEGVRGMEAVAHVLANRAGSGRYPSDPAAVALQPSQFSVWNQGEGRGKTDYDRDSREYKTAAEAIDRVFSGQSQDPTNGALFYHTPQVNPRWSSEVNRYGTTQLGNHIFYNGNPVPPRDIPNVVASRLDTQPRPIPPLPRLDPRVPNRMDLAADLIPSNVMRQELEMQGQSYVAQDRNRPSQVRLPTLPPPSAQTRNVPMPRLDPRLPNRMDLAADSVPQNVMRQELQLQGQSYAGQERASPRQVATPAPQRPVPQSIIERVPPPRVVPNSVVTQSVQAAQAATNPALSAALARSTIPAGVPVNNRSRDSVAQAAMGAAFTPPAAIPAPSSMPKSQDRLAAGIYPQAPVGVPSVASALSVVPLPAIAPAIAPRQQAVTGFPTALDQRPMLQPQRSLAAMTMPTPVAQRPAQSQPLRIAVNGANSYSGGRSPAPQTITGSSTGKSYNVGQKFQSGGYRFEATPSGFKNLGRV
jgi:hypothetical protein